MATGFDCARTRVSTALTVALRCRPCAQNVTITSFGASLRTEAAGGVISAFLRSPARMRRVALTMLPLTEEHVSSVAAWLASKQVRAGMPSRRAPALSSGRALPTSLAKAPRMRALSSFLPPVTLRPRQCALTDLDLSYAIDDAGGARVARALHLNQSLTRLSLAHNRLGANAGGAMAEALRANATLTHACLAGNLLTDAATVALAAALANNRTLTRLDLGRNSINAIGAQALRQALHTNQSLTSLGSLNSLPIAVGLRSSLEWCAAVATAAGRRRDLRLACSPSHLLTCSPSHLQVFAQKPGACCGPRDRGGTRGDTTRLVAQTAATGGARAAQEDLQA